jgi:carboxylesterase
MPGAEPFSHDGSRIGVLLCHGFTGTPQSLRAWAEQLAAEDLTVRLPRLPGHGTTWQELNMTRWQDWYAEVERALLDLGARCDAVFVAGLSMGGSLALRLAQQHPRTVAGLILVNPAVHTEDPARRLLPILRHVIASLPGIAFDIKRPAAVEVAYDRLPLHAAHSLTQLWGLIRHDLPAVTAPLLLLHSTVDHVVAPSNTARVLAAVSSRDVTVVELADSYHVATLDNDAPRIFAETLAFVRRLTPAAATGGESGRRPG